MRSFSLISICGLLLAATACESSSSDSGGELNSQDDVQRLFQAVVPDLVEALTELANDQFSAALGFSSSGDKGGGSSSSVPCPGGGTLSVNLATGQATLTNCSAGGVTISATLLLFVDGTLAPSYQANFSGPLTVSGTFNGTVEVTDALIQWIDPATDANTYWDVTVLLNGQSFTVTSGDSGNGMGTCPAFDPPEGPGSGPPGAPCDDDSDCQANSCRDPISNPDEGCTCRNLRGADCSQCIGVNAAPFDLPPNRATSCTDVGDFTCSCLTESGETLDFFPSAQECFF